jgi:hypothetical protein
MRGHCEHPLGMLPMYLGWLGGSFGAEVVSRDQLEASRF